MNKTRAPKFTKVACFACNTCAYRWNSARGQIGVFQKCKYCFKNCYPTEFKWKPPNKNGNMNKETFIGHNTELCGKCIELGYSCQGDFELIHDSFDCDDLKQGLNASLLTFLKPKISKKRISLKNIYKERAESDFLEFELDWKTILKKYLNELMSKNDKNLMHCKAISKDHLKLVLDILKSHNVNIDWEDLLIEIYSIEQIYSMGQEVNLRGNVYYLTIDKGLPEEYLTILEVLAKQVYGEFVQFL